jgi:NAD(P)-dependent dehydrogenase (short-subunit alcohol dehydrogenase family)
MAQGFRGHRARCLLKREEAESNAKDTIAAEGGHVAVELADVASVAAVRALAERILARHDRVRALVDHAGVSLRDRRVSVEGLEMIFATNVLGGFAIEIHRAEPRSDANEGP